MIIPFLKLAIRQEYNYDDFEMYDSSAKVLYFKSYHPEFVDYKGSEFSFFADAVLIYKGYFWSGYSSSFPSTPYVTSDPFFYYQNHALGFEYINQNQPDPRNDSRLMSAFKEKTCYTPAYQCQLNQSLSMEHRLPFHAR
ncbi:MAG: hypothetical protein MZV63_60815 [Marinilabiliales bacterium]|nr:hypothetical protein [Marinilabiliales bacterium]